MPANLLFPLALLFPVAMAWAASSDLLTMRISNRLVLFLVASFLVVALVLQLPLAQWGSHLGAGALALAIGFTLFAFGWIGGGDAKLAAATALWLGFGEGGLHYLVYSGLLGGLLTLLILAFRNLPLMPILARHAWLERLHDPKTGVPYGIALAIAGMIVYANSTIFERLVA
ncbi:MAG: prepilin peptidase [Candidatus Devosia phytovorans]|uniref:Prepilin peptidase n=1 Tax=Candidatus Devosia phytovorans TaxID=3121372 RepID=A0AAJ5VRX2_9HYPH|nr:prepilin peptidase [Devosia sp.]WEK03569.1 MAG: prepilin peptidase [Devosia sp.]